MGREEVTATAFPLYDSLFQHPKETKMRKQTVGTLIVAFSFLFLTVVPCRADGTINACVKKKGGAIRIVTDLSLCKTKTESPLSWSAVQKLSFSLSPGASSSFALPETQSPVRIEVSLTFLNGGTQTPSEIMYAVVNQDQQSGQMTWIGTNSDGSQAGSSSLDNTQIASIGGGNAVLEVDNLSSGTVRISQSATRTSIAGHYIVRIWY